MTSVSDPELVTDDEHVTDSSPEPGFFQRFSEGVSRIPLRTRIGLLVMLAVGAAVAVGSLASYLTVRNQIVSSVDANLKGSAVIARTAMATDQKVVIPHALTALVRPDGTPAGFDSNAPYGSPEIAVAAGNSPMSIRTVQFQGQRYREIAIPYDIQGQQGALVIAQSLYDTQQTLDRLSFVSILVGIAGIAAAGMAGFAIGRAGLRPVERLTEAAEYVASTGDLRPIEVRGSDELARLTTSFNAMLTGLRRSQDHQRRLVADAGHELRTPLTSMRTNIELLTQSFKQSSAGRELSPGERDEIMKDVRAQMEELSILVIDLVELSRDEHPTAATRDQVDLADVVRQAVERVRHRAPDLEYDVRLEPWEMEGDAAALERMVTNLLDNAAKWSPPKGTVRVELADGHLQVADEGPGIADEDLTHVFERFYRSPEARMLPGSGLGLAIVRQVAEHHGGRVAAARAPIVDGHGGGALLGVWLPQAGSGTAGAGTGS